MEKLLLLHGAIGSSKQLEELKNKLSSDYEVFTVDFIGHGGRHIPDDGFSIEMFANDVLNFLQANGISSINVFGYSMGGYVALFLARYYPERINKIVTLATKFDWNVEDSIKDAAMLDATTILNKVPAFAEVLAARHYPADWKTVLQKTKEMLLNMGEKNVMTDADFKAINHHVLMTVGDKDQMVSINETLHISQLMINSHFILLKETSHPIEKLNVELLNDAIKNFV